MQKDKDFYKKNGEYLVKRYHSGVLIDAVRSSLSANDWCWLMDFVCSNACSKMDCCGELIFLVPHTIEVQNESHDIVFRSATYQGI